MLTRPVMGGARGGGGHTFFLTSNFDDIFDKTRQKEDKTRQNKAKQDDFDDILTLKKRYDSEVSSPNSDPFSMEIS